MRPDVKKLIDDLLVWVRTPEPIPAGPRAHSPSSLGALTGRLLPGGATLPWVLASFLLGTFIAYLVLLSLLVPRNWPLAGPLIDAALKAAPAEPRLRFRDEKDQIINPQVPVTPGQIIKVQIEPRPEDANIEYVWQIEGVEEYWGTDPWERWLRVPDRKPGEPPSLIMVIVKHPDGDTLDSWMLPVEDGDQK